MVWRNLDPQNFRKIDALSGLVQDLKLQQLEGRFAHASCGTRELAISQQVKTRVSAAARWGSTLWSLQLLQHYPMGVNPVHAESDIEMPIAVRPSNPWPAFAADCWSTEGWHYIAIKLALPACIIDMRGHASRTRMWLACVCRLLRARAEWNGTGEKPRLHILASHGQSTGALASPCQNTSGGPAA
eukprot:4291453-Amphidinium_carterae.1